MNEDWSMTDDGTKTLKPFHLSLEIVSKYGANAAAVLHAIAGQVDYRQKQDATGCTQYAGYFHDGNCYVAYPQIRRHGETVAIKRPCLADLCPYMSPRTFERTLDGLKRDRLVVAIANPKLGRCSKSPSCGSITRNCDWYTVPKNVRRKILDKGDAAANVYFWKHHAELFGLERAILWNKIGLIFDANAPVEYVSLAPQYLMKITGLSSAVIRSGLAWFVKQGAIERWPDSCRYRILVTNPCKGMAHQSVEQEYVSPVHPALATPVANPLYRAVPNKPQQTCTEGLVRLGAEHPLTMRCLTPDIAVVAKREAPPAEPIEVMPELEKIDPRNMDEVMKFLFAERN